MSRVMVQSYMTQHGRFTYRGMLHAQVVADAIEADAYVGRLVDDHLLRTDAYDPKEESRVPCEVQVMARGLDPCLTATRAEVAECCQRDADAAEARNAFLGR